MTCKRNKRAVAIQQEAGIVCPKIINGIRTRSPRLSPVGRRVWECVEHRSGAWESKLVVRVKGRGVR